LSLSPAAAGHLLPRSAARVLARPASALRRPPADCDQRSRNLEAAFCSPATTRLSAGRGGIKRSWPTSSAPRHLPSGPFGSHLPPRRLSSESGAINNQSPLPAGPAPPPVLPPARHSPPGYHPSGSKRSTRRRTEELTVTLSPISLRSPSVSVLPLTFVAPASRPCISVRWPGRLLCQLRHATFSRRDL
jgi:hypothetical protein